MAVPLLNKKIVKKRVKQFKRPQSDRRITVKVTVLFQYSWFFQCLNFASLSKKRLCSYEIVMRFNVTEEVVSKGWLNGWGVWEIWIYEAQCKFSYPILISLFFWWNISVLCSYENVINYNVLKNHFLCYFVLGSSTKGMVELLR